MCAAVDDPQPVRLLVDVQVHHNPTIHLALIWRVAIPVWAAVARRRGVARVPPDPVGQLEHRPALVGDVLPSRKVQAQVPG